MSKLMESRPVMHAILWIVLYIVLVNVGDALSETTGIPYMTGALLLFLSAVLLTYLWKNQRLRYYGFCKVSGQDIRRVLLYLPLIVLALIQLFVGVPETMPVPDVLNAFVLMTGTGFIEEVVFRGFLYQSIAQRRGVVAAILISGVTFGLGHIVNLLRGYTSVMQTEQIITAVVIGIALAMLVAITRSIVPGILFHIAFNVIGTVTDTSGDAQTYAFIAILTVSALYAIYLIRFVPKPGKKQRTV